MSKLYSIIIPIYKVEKYLRKCIDSVVSQTYTNIEIILVNDGSPDGCYDICKEYEKIDKRIKVVDKENGGLSSARNAGLDIATGDYVYFLDSDDYINVSLIEIINNKIKDNDLLIFNNYEVNEDGKILKKSNISIGKQELSCEKDIFNYILKNYLEVKSCYQVWNKVFTTKIIKENNLRFEDNTTVFSEDVCFILYYLLHSHRIIAIEDVLYYYLQRDTSIMGQNRKRQHINQFVNICKLTLNHIDSMNEDMKYFKENYYILFHRIIENQYVYAGKKNVYKYIKEITEIEFYKENVKTLTKKPKELIRIFGIKKGTQYYIDNLGYRYNNFWGRLLLNIDSMLSKIGE